MPSDTRSVHPPPEIRPSELTVHGLEQRTASSDNGSNLVERGEALDTGTEVTCSQKEICDLIKLDLLLVIVPNIKLTVRVSSRRTGEEIVTYLDFIAFSIICLGLDLSFDILEH